MRLVIVESPYAGDIEANVAYARACLGDCLSRGEAPFACHLLYTQPGVLRDESLALLQDFFRRRRAEGKTVPEDAA